MRLLRGLQIILETLLLEAALVVGGYQLFFNMVDWRNWSIIAVAMVAAVPAPIYAGWRSPELSLPLGAVTGLLVATGMIAYLWTDAYLNPCPPQAMRCMQYLGAYFGSSFALLGVLPAFMALTPAAGYVFDSLGWRRYS